MKFKFNGYKEGLTLFGDGKFTINKVYECDKVDTYRADLAADARFIDDNGIAIYEEIHHFTEVLDD